jgi:large subunit ribosomal protein L9
MDPMKVLFLKDVTDTAYAGDIKEVKPGFARNYLLPQSIAVAATKSQMNRVEGLRKAASRRREATETEMNGLAEKLQASAITIQARAGRNDRLYGAITSAAIALEISKIAGRDIDRRRVVMAPIHQLGTYSVPVKLYQGFEPKIQVIVTTIGGQPAEDEEVAEPQAEAVAEQPVAEAPAVEPEKTEAAPLAARKPKAKKAAKKAAAEATEKEE